MQIIIRSLIFALITYGFFSVIGYDTNFMSNEIISSISGSATNTEESHNSTTPPTNTAMNASTSTTQNSSGIITNLLNTITGFIHHITDSTDPISNTVSALTGSGSTLQEKITALGGYIQATKGYNSSMTIFGKTMTEHLDNAKQGKSSTHMSLPNYDNLESSLQRAKEKGSSGFKDIDDAVENLQSILIEIVPLHEEIENYVTASSIFQ